MRMHDCGIFGYRGLTGKWCLQYAMGKLVGDNMQLC